MCVLKWKFSTKWFGQELPLSAGREQPRGEEAQQAAGELAELAVEEEVAILAGDLAPGDEPIGESELGAELRHSRRTIEKSVRADLDSEAVVILGSNVAPGGSAIFENRDGDVRCELLQAKGGGEAREATAYNHDVGHTVIVFSSWVLAVRGYLGIAIALGVGPHCNG